MEALLPIPGTTLVVEDDPIIRTLLTDILSELGAQSASFATADDALEYLRAPHEFCPLVIVDHGLPGKIQGTEFIALVQDQWPFVCSILTSGYALDPDTLPGQTVYLDKPWTPDQLVACIEALLHLQPIPLAPSVVQPD
ncbi:response regulator [Pseudomonas jessenii]|uniref:response regulator n=1 Tax=Pseudomonas jessenii TaxID=77298 RepID=UPI0032E47BBA